MACLHVIQCLRTGFSLLTMTSTFNVCCWDSVCAWCIQTIMRLMEIKTASVA